MKAAIGRCLMNRTAIPVSRRSTLKLLQEASALADAFSANGQVKFAVHLVLFSTWASGLALMWGCSRAIVSQSADFSLLLGFCGGSHEYFVA